MHFFKTLLAGAALVASSVLAQEPLVFTTFPSNVVAGTPVTVTWAGGNPNEPVTITLRQGPRDDLEDVEVLTSSGTGGSFTWTPEEDIVNGLDYALMISQGEVVNYTDLFSISGGVDAPASSSSGTTSTITLSSRTSSARSTSTSTTESESSTTESPSSSTRAPPSSTTRAPTATASPDAASSAMFSSPMALILGALGAFIYIN